MVLLSARTALLSRLVLAGGWPEGGEGVGGEGGSAGNAAGEGDDAAGGVRARFARLAFGAFASPAAISPVCVRVRVCACLLVCVLAVRRAQRPGLEQAQCP